MITWEETFSPLDIGIENYDWAAEDIDLTNDGGAIVAVDNGQFGFLKLNNIHEDALIKAMRLSILKKEEIF